MKIVMKRILCLLLAFTPAVASAEKVWNRGKGATWNCKKDPVVTINHGKGKYTFKGACTTVNVNGASHTITAERIDTLNVNGSKNHITVATTTTINVTGTKNNVTWKSGSAPAINNVGKDNVIAQTGGGSAPSAPAGAKTPAPNPPATAPATAAFGTTIDCAKTASFSYAENDGAFSMIGKCDKIVINGNNNKLKVESAKVVMLNGNDNRVDAGAVDMIATAGNDNVVTYKTAVTAKAKVKVSNAGNDNKVSAVK